MLTINVMVPTQHDAQETARWVSDFVDALPSGVREALAAHGLNGPPLVTAAEPQEVSASSDLTSVNAQLDRLAEYWPSFSARLRQLHDGLTAFGYEPLVPAQVSSNRRASYLSYIDPVDGRNIGNTNSGTFTFMRKELRDELGDNPLVKVARYATVHFDSDEAVGFILSTAHQHKK
jgi:hypothetical protein